MTLQHSHFVVIFLENSRKSTQPTNFDLTMVYQDPVTCGYVIFLPDMPHFSRKSVTVLKFSGSKDPQQEIKFGKYPLDLIMVVVGDDWLKSDGASYQLHNIKLSVHHFDKNAYSQTVPFNHHHPHHQQ